MYSIKSQKNAPQRTTYHRRLKIIHTAVRDLFLSYTAVLFLPHAPTSVSPQAREKDPPPLLTAKNMKKKKKHATVWFTTAGAIEVHTGTIAPSTPHSLRQDIQEFGPFAATVGACVENPIHTDIDYVPHTKNTTFLHKSRDKNKNHQPRKEIF